MKTSIVDIRDGHKIQELLDEDDEAVERGSTVSSNDSDESELGVVPQLFFSAFSTLTFLVPLVSAHIALDIIVHQQYAQDFDVVNISLRAGTAAVGISTIILIKFYYF